MSIENTFGRLFKSEIKASGQKLAAQDKVSLATKSDTLIQAFVRTTPSFRVSLTSTSVSSAEFDASCNCPAAQKNRFCKHVWATLICTEKDFPDFLSEKTLIENASIGTISAPAKPAYQESEKQKIYNEMAKLKASIYRKERYQKQKEQVEKRKGRAKESEDSHPADIYPVEVQRALDYFKQNGFEMPNGPSREIMIEAKKKLSRIFHPDKGGTHQESVELNKHCEALEPVAR